MLKVLLISFSNFFLIPIVCSVRVELNRWGLQVDVDLVSMLHLLIHTVEKMGIN